MDRLDGFVDKLGTLPGVRRSVDERVADRARVLHEYSELIDAGFAMYSATTPADGRITASARTLTSFGLAREYMSREDALLTGALAAAASPAPNAPSSPSWSGRTTRCTASARATCPPPTAPSTTG